MAVSAALKQVREERDQLKGQVMRLEADVTSKTVDYDTVQQYRAEERAELDLLKAEIRTFNTILDKIIRMTNGKPMVDRSDVSGGGWASMAGQVMRDEDKPSFKQQQTIQIIALQEGITTLERRLSAARAIAEFAKEHKA